MTTLEKKWELLPQNFNQAEELSRELGKSPLCAQVLIHRGIQSAGSARSFLSPKLSALNDPLEIPQIKEAAQRIFLARERNEKVLVFGDYDVDGVSGTALLVLALRYLGLTVDHYIPHRYAEGYALNFGAIEEIAGRGVKLIVTVDCGISNVAEIARARELNLDVIVTDHHNIPAQCPAALALINPKFLDADHPSRFLAGVGVAFKFVWGLFKLAGIKDAAFLMDLLDLVCLGTLSDVVPLTRENRIFAIHGLAALNKKKRLGLKCLMEVAGLKGKISVHQVNFMLSPRLNAAGRLKHANLSLELLLAEDEGVARNLAQQLNATNVDRQGIGSEIQAEVFGQLEKEAQAQEKIIVLRGNHWHPGVIGIVASQVTERFFKPAVLIGVEDGVGRGSARSVHDVDVFAILDSCRSLFVDFGGHAGAAGFEIEEDKIPVLIEQLRQTARLQICDDDLVAKINLEAEIDPKILTLSLAKEMELMDPFGEDNPPPIFVSNNLRATDWTRVGANKKHLKARFTDGMVTLETIGFGMGGRAPELNFDEEFDLAYNLQTNEWNGLVTVQLNLVDIRVSEKSQISNPNNEGDKK